MLPRRPNPLPDIFFEKVHYSDEFPASAPVDLYAFGNNYRDLNREIVDPVIEKEIEKFMKKFGAEEEEFVDQSLRENPVICYNRISNNDISKPSTSKAAKKEKPLKCTRCKMLAKIKKAKFKLRYKFITMKLEQNASTLQSLRNFIASAEDKLRIKGRTEGEIKELRDAMGIDRVRVENLSHINRQFFKAAEKAPEE